MLIIRWLGQACFLLSALTGTHILVDPPNPQVGYHIAAHSVPAGAVFVSHEHPDHNYTAAARGTSGAYGPGGTPGTGRYSIIQPGPAPTPQQFDVLSDSFSHHPISIAPSPAPGWEKTGDVNAALEGQTPLMVPYERIFAYHDDVHGAKRGTDIITVFQTGGLRVCHLGDLGQLSLTPEQVREVGHVDVLMIPVGGFFTVDGPQAAAIVGQLHPRVILPMHYRTAALNPDLRAKLAPPEAFLTAMRGKAAVIRVSARDLTLSPQTLPKTPTIYLLRYE